MTTKKTWRHVSTEGFQLPYQGWRTSRGGDFASEIRSEEGEARVEPRPGATPPRPSPRRRAAPGRTAKTSGNTTTPRNQWHDADRRLAKLLKKARDAVAESPGKAQQICDDALRSPHAELNLVVPGGDTYRDAFCAVRDRAREGRPAEAKRNNDGSGKRRKGKSGGKKR